MKQIILHFFKSLAGRIAGLLFVTLLLVGGWIALQYFNINLFGFKFGRELKIDKTANVIEKIRSISEFTTACYYEEAVLKSRKTEAGKQNKLMSLVHIEADSLHSEVVILAKGRVRAGGEIYNVDIYVIKNQVKNIQHIV